jgi:hypothetical protein
MIGLNHTALDSQYQVIPLLLFRARYQSPFLSTCMLEQSQLMTRCQFFRLICANGLENGEIESPTFRMQSGRSTTELIPLNCTLGSKFSQCTPLYHLSMGDKMKRNAS